MMTTLSITLNSASLPLPSTNAPLYSSILKLTDARSHKGVEAYFTSSFVIKSKVRARCEQSEVVAVLLRGTVRAEGGVGGLSEGLIRGRGGLPPHIWVCTTGSRTGLLRLGWVQPCVRSLGSGGVGLFGGEGTHTCTPLHQSL